MTSNPSSVLSGCRPVLAAAAAFSLFGNLLVLAVPLMSMQIYDRVLGSRSGITLAMLVAVVMLALAVHAVLEGVRGRLMVLVGLWLERRWAPELLAETIRRGTRADRPPNAQALRDLSTLRGFFGGTGIFHLFDAPWVPVYIVILFLLHPHLGWLTSAGAVVLLGLALATELLTRRGLRTAGAAMSSQLSRADDYVRRAEVIEAMGMLPGIRDLWSAESARALDMMERGWRVNALLSAIARFVRFAVQVGVLACSAWLVINDQLSTGAIIASSILLTRALSPVDSLVGSWKHFVSARAALARLDKDFAQPSPTRGSTRLPIPTGRLRFERVGVRVDGLDRPILAGIDLELAPGEALGIIGPSAAGKSTLARVALGLLPPTSGRARLDGADVATWSREDLGRHIGYLPQDIELFPGSVKRNIARMGEPDDELVIAAAQLAGVHEMILRLPMGYDTEIGDALRSLSGGQRQRVAIARAFYGQPRLLVLDEPNSNLDAEGENALIRALMNARERRITTIVIAHRARVLMTMDRLLLLKDGRIEALGPREQVMARVLPAQHQPAAARAQIREVS